MNLYLTSSQGGGWLSIIMVVGMLAVLYFFMIRPQRKQEKETANMRNSLAIGDEVVTIGGIVGIIVGINDKETVTIVTSRDRTRLNMLKSSISKVLVPAASEEKEESKN